MPPLLYSLLFSWSPIWIFLGVLPLVVFLLVSTLSLSNDLIHHPAQTALLVTDFPNLHTQLWPLPRVPKSCFHYLYITSLIYVLSTSGRLLPSASHQVQALDPSLTITSNQSPSPERFSLAHPCIAFTTQVVPLLQAHHFQRALP